MSKVLCFSNQKGGVAKTTTAFNVAGVIANFRYRVLMIDADPHSGLTESFGYEPDQLENTFYNVLIEKDYPIEKALIKTDIPNIDLIPANLDLAAAKRELIGMVQWDKKIVIDHQAIADGSITNFLPRREL